MYERNTVTISHFGMFERGIIEVSHLYVRNGLQNNLKYRRVRKRHNNLTHRWFGYTYIDEVTEETTTTTTATTTTTTTTLHYFYFLSIPATVQNVKVSADRHTAVILLTAHNLSRYIVLKVTM